MEAEIIQNAIREKSFGNNYNMQLGANTFSSTVAAETASSNSPFLKIVNRTNSNLNVNGNGNDNFSEQSTPRGRRRSTFRNSIVSIPNAMEAASEAYLASTEQSSVAQTDDNNNVTTIIMSSPVRRTSLFSVESLFKTDADEDIDGAEVGNTDPTVFWKLPDGIVADGSSASRTNDGRLGTRVSIL